MSAVSGLDFSGKKCLVLLSGGKDSLLSACQVIEEGFITYLVHYDNGCSLDTENIYAAVEALIGRYGTERVKFLGIFQTAGVWRTLLYPVINKKPSEIVAGYGEITFSQTNCLTCRTAMYVYSIALCKKHQIEWIVEGARRAQGFAVEQPDMLERYRDLLVENDLILHLPMEHVPETAEGRFRVENELLMSGVVLKSVSEPQCLFGAPLNCESLPQDILDGVSIYFDKEIKGRIKELVDLVGVKLAV